MSSTHARTQASPAPARVRRLMKGTNAPETGHWQRVPGCAPGHIWEGSGTEAGSLPPSFASPHHSSVTPNPIPGDFLAEHVSPASRERIVQDLAEHFAQDRLTLPEYERRVELA